MNIAGIDHLELYVGDAQQSAFYYGSAFGFAISGRGGPETGLTAQRSLVLTQGGARLMLTSGLNAEHPASEYVRRHGDGVAVVALAVDDVAACFAELVARGVEPVSPPAEHHDETGSVTVAEVSGFGDVIHRLVQRTGDGFLPGVVAPLEQLGDAAADVLAEIDHLAVCVPAGELVATSQFYQRVFGFSEIFTESIEVAGQGMESIVVQSPSGLVTLTLIEPDPTRRPGQIDDFLHWHGGAGVQHIALSTADIVGAVHDLHGRGVRFLSTPSSYYDTIVDRVGELPGPVADLAELGILVDRDHWGQLLQIFTETTHIRRTMFLELVQRRGARTFGSGNIKALYEAKERELVQPPQPIAVEVESTGELEVGLGTGTEAGAAHVPGVSA